MVSNTSGRNERLSSISSLLLTDCLRLGAEFHAGKHHRVVGDVSPAVHEQHAVAPTASESLKQPEVRENVLKEDSGSAETLELLPTHVLQQFTSGHWEYHCGIRLKWVQVDAEEDLILKDRYLKSRSSPLSGIYHVHSVPYEVDFSTLRRKNLATMKERHARFVGDLPFAPPPRSKLISQKKVVAASHPDPDPQPPEEYSEPSSLYIVDDKGEHVYVWLRVDIGNLLQRAKVGHVEVDIRRKFIEARVLDADRKQTLIYRWVRLREIDVAHSSWRASQDGDRLVIKLAKSSVGTQPWKTIFENPEAGKHYFSFTQESWPDVIGLVQGCWCIEMGDVDCVNIDDEDAFPCRAIIFGCSVVIFGSCDFLQRRRLSIDRGSITMTEDGEVFHGKVAKKGGRIDWDDGEVWTRNKAFDASLGVGNCEPLSQEALNTEVRETMPSEESCILLNIELEEDTTTRLGQQQKELLAMLVEDSDTESTEGAGADLELNDKQPLPPKLLSQIRVCCLDSLELTPQTAPLTLARLQREMPLADVTEIAALSSMELSLRWFSEFLAPAQQATLNAAIQRVQLLLEEAHLRQKKAGPNEVTSLGERKTFPSWWVSMLDPPLARIATCMLRDELRRLRPSGRFVDRDGEPPLSLAFAAARRAVVAQIWSVDNLVQRIRCLRSEVARARRFAALSMIALAQRGGWIDFNDSGVLVLSSVVDWTTLLVARQEAERWFLDSVECEEACTRIECSSVDLLQKGHRCLYACARICRLVLAHAGMLNLTREAGMAAGDGFLYLEKELLQDDDEAGASAFLCVTTPESSFATWQVAMPAGLPDCNINPCGGMLLVCRRKVFLAKALPHASAEIPIWIRITV